MLKVSKHVSYIQIHTYVHIYALIETYIRTCIMCVYTYQHIPSGFNVHKIMGLFWPQKCSCLRLNKRIALRPHVLWCRHLILRHLTGGFRTIFSGRRHSYWLIGIHHRLKSHYGLLFRPFSYFWNHFRCVHFSQTNPIVIAMIITPSHVFFKTRVDWRALKFFAT